MGTQNNFSYNISSYNIAASNGNLHNFYINRWFKAAINTVITPSAANAHNNIYLQNIFKVRILASINASKHIFINHNFTAKLLSAVYSGRRARFTRTMTAKLNGITRIGKNIKINRRNLAYIGSHTQAGMTEYLLMEIGTTIPPGGEIRINSENFTAMQGFGNILVLHKGDWIFVGPDTHTISVTASGGRVFGQLVYTERHL